MQKKLISVTAVLILTFFLSGCAASDSGVVLREAEDRSLEGISSDGAVSGTLDEGSSDDAIRESVIEEPVSDTTPQMIAVYVCGAVKSPGVYELEDGSRICDALYAADGFSEVADEDYVNLAALLTDGMKLYIPTISETSKEPAASGIESYDNFGDKDPGEERGKALVNINTATKEELKTLPGIGDGIAGKIVKYREEKGAFKSCDDIMKVSGIKEKLFSKIRDYITV